MMENVSGPLVLGERLKKRFLEVNVGSTLLVRPLAIFLLVVACSCTIFRTYSSSFLGIISSIALSMTLSTRF